jgi:hypothetical protein
MAACGRELLVNGDFESPAFSADGWGVFTTIEGWRTSFGPGIEIQRHVAGQPHTGAQHVELDSHASSGMVQDVPTMDGEVYEIRFALSARPGWGCGTPSTSRHRPPTAPLLGNSAGGARRRCVPVKERALQVAEGEVSGAQDRAHLDQEVGAVAGRQGASRREGRTEHDIAHGGDDDVGLGPRRSRVGRCGLHLGPYHVGRRRCRGRRLHQARRAPRRRGARWAGACCQAGPREDAADRGPHGLVGDHRGSDHRARPFFGSAAAWSGRPDATATGHPQAIGVGEPCRNRLPRVSPTVAARGRGDPRNRVRQRGCV